MVYSTQRVSTVYISGDSTHVKLWGLKDDTKNDGSEDSIGKPHVLQVQVDRDVQKIQPDFKSAEGADVNYMQQ